MSANNHDSEDPNNVRYAKKSTNSVSEKENQRGMQIHIYTNTLSKPLGEWIKWMDEQGYKLTK